MSFLPLAVPIMSRDATLTKDSKLLNCFWEPTADGRNVVIKRPGIRLFSTLVAGTVQGAGNRGQLPYTIINDTCYPLLGGTSFALPGVTTAGEPMTTLEAIQSSGEDYMLIKSQHGLWYFTGGVLTKVTDADYPASTVPGIVLLDGTYYVLNFLGSINGSAINDVTSWDALNFVNIDRGLGFPVALFRHLNYVVAFCDYGVQFFYDAGNPSPGSPLLPSGNTLTTVGCVNATSIQSINQLTIFLSKNAQFGRSVSAISGLSLVTLSNPIIDRILNSSTCALIHSMAFKTAGHSFYIITLDDLNLTLALDLTTGDWAQWSSSTDGLTDTKLNAAFCVRGSIVPSNPDYIISITGGYVCTIDPSYYYDIVSNPIRVLGRTANLEHNTLDRKFLPSVNLVGDTVTTFVQLSYSDNDYQTYSSQRAIDMSTIRKLLRRLGSFRRRSFQWLHVDNTPLRLEALEIPDDAAPTPITP